MVKTVEFPRSPLDELLVAIPEVNDDDDLSLTSMPLVDKMSSTQGRSSRAGASLMGSTATSGAEQGVVWSNCLSETRVAIPASFLLWVRILGFKTHQYSVLRHLPFGRTLGPVDRACGQALSAASRLCHSPSSSLRYSLGARKFVDLTATSSDFDEVLSEDCDDIPETFFYMV